MTAAMLLTDETNIMDIFVLHVKLADLPDSPVDFSQGQFLQRKAKQCKQSLMHLEYKTKMFIIAT